MRTVRRILVPIKTPDAKLLPAVRKAAQIARAFGAEIELFHAVATPLDTGRVGRGIGWDFPAGEAIVRRAMRVDADFIVAECHAGERRGSWLLRLTDWELVRMSAVPLLLVKSKRPYRHPVLLAPYVAARQQHRERFG